MPFRLPHLCLATLLVTLTGGGLLAQTGEAAARDCPPQQAPPGYAARVERALVAKQDVWGNRLLAAPGGPTYERAQRLLTPLLLAYGRGKQPLTDSGVHYVPFGQPLDDRGAGSVALHVADGGQIVSERAGGRRLTVLVGRGGERYGSCLQRLATPRLLEGYLPVLETSYVDAAGARYRQESFAIRLPETRSLVSLLRLTVDTRESTAATTNVRLAPSETGLAVVGNRLRRAGATHLAFDEGGRFDGAAVSYSIRRGETRTVFAAWVNYPAAGDDLEGIEAEAYERGRSSLVEFWTRRLEEGTSFEVPDRRATDAARALTIQNLALTWRYSIGNPYEQFSFPEGLDMAQVLAELGFPAVSRAILRTSLTRRPTPYANWKMGEKLLGSATQYRLHRDRGYVLSVTPVLRRYVTILGGQIQGSATGLLDRERYSSDIPDQVYGLHAQAVVWQGLRWMGLAWAETGRTALARRCRDLARRLEQGLRRAVAASQQRLPDGSLFVPVRLLDREQAYDSVTQSRAGSYWNLVMPYALASGLFRPGSPQAVGALRYLLRHGSRFLGVVRAGAYSLYRDPVFPTGGTDHVYGINVARFLAANDQADQLVLSLYGALGAAMTPGTFVSGEAASVAPVPGRYHRSMYLPPNAASNAAFLETLRVMLVNETTRADGVPSGLQLAFATPRQWLLPGARIAVRDAATSFGPLSYTIDAAAASLLVSLEVPSRRPPPSLQLRLRLPLGSRLTRVSVNGSAYRRFDAAGQTIDLSGLRGALRIEVGVRRGSG